VKKYVLLTFILVACSLLFFGLSRFVTAQDAKVAPDSVTLDCSFGKITFSHKGHTAAAGECKTCHHMGTPDQKCVVCHSKEAKVNAQNAFHKNCIDCHKKEAKGPTGCMDCHKK
jgi:hypothetical protein